MNKKLLGFFLAAALAITPSCKRAFATISSLTTQTTSALGNSSTTNFTIGYTFRANADILVYLVEESTTPDTITPVTYGTGAGKYTITGGDPGTTVVMGTAPSTTQRVVVKRNTPKTQLVDYDPNSVFPADSHETAMDKIEMSLQELDNNKLGASTLSVSGDVLQYNGTNWVSTSLNLGSLATFTGILSPQYGGTGVANSGLYTYGASSLQFVTTGATSVKLPTTGYIPSAPGSSTLSFTLSGDTTLKLPTSGVVPSAAGTSSFAFTLSGPTSLTLPKSGTLIAQPSSRSEVYMTLFTGFGATNTFITRFTTQTVYTGTEIVLSQSSTLGDTFTIASDGTYAMTLNWGSRGSTGSQSGGIVKNSTILTNTYGAQVAANKLCYVEALAVSGSGEGGGSCSVIVDLVVGDVIRVHGNPTITTPIASGSNDNVSFRIRKLY